MLIRTKNPLLTLNDVTVVPATISEIDSRTQCDAHYKQGDLPVFTAPMSCVIDDKNWEIFSGQKINVVIPRNINLDTRIELSEKVFVAIGLDELEYIMLKYKFFTEKHYICIDIANGHMMKLYNLCKRAKEQYGDNVSIMTGNIANPDTYDYIVRKYPGVIDYIRCGIGGGSACTTAANCSIHYPLASLITEIYAIKKSYGVSCPKIIADGGFSNFDHIIKALALGADYVMLGKIFAKADEACGKTFIDYDYKKYSNALVYTEPDDIYGDRNYVKFREYYGMSTKKAQKEFGGIGNKTSEGVVRHVLVEYSLSQWIDNFISYLKSAMSYTSNWKLEQFIGEPMVLPITNSAFASYFK